MLDRNLLPGCLLGAAMVMIASPAYAIALQPVEVANIARATVVQIQPTINSPGSGVIIGRYRERATNVYLVLTAAHVVQYPDDQYQVVTPPLPRKGAGLQRKQRQKIAISTERDIQQLPGVDLAIVRFRSDRIYQTATLGDSNYATEGAGVYIAGFPNPGATITKRIFQFTSSLVSARLDEDSVEGEEEVGALEGGYAISYTNVTRAGMSGGPIFDVAGRVVGIHGKGDGDRIAGNESTPGVGQESAPQTSVIKSGFNLGIPILTFLKLVPNITRNLGVKFDRSQPGVLPGGGLIAIRGDRSSQPSGSNVPRINISEQEDSADDMVVGKPKNASRSNLVAPQNNVPRQISAPPNTPPRPNPASRSGGRFF